MPPLLLLLAIILLHSTLSSSLQEESTTASRFKAPNNAWTPPELVVEQWKREDESLWEYVESHVPAVLEHTGAAAFDEHLKGVQALLRGWKAPPHLTKAGLFHSIYGTEGFQGFSLSLEERKNIQEIIGEQAEYLCWIFCMVDRYSVDQTVFAWQNETINTTTQFVFQARPELGRFDIVLDKETWLDFIELTLADWMEQVEGAALTPSDIFHWNKGEAYSYRRLAYRKMSQILAAERPERLQEIVPNMLEAVMATESLETRHLHQERTPPMSLAAKNALDALRSAGESIPVDFSPQPMTNDDQQQQQPPECTSTL